MDAMTQKKRKNLDAALRSLFQQREAAKDCERLAAFMRALPVQTA